jgi:hypothetical protein
MGDFVDIMTELGGRILAAISVAVTGALVFADLLGGPDHSTIIRFLQDVVERGTNGF